MNILKNSSELIDCTRLIKDLLVPISESLPYDVYHDVCPPDGQFVLRDDFTLFDDASSPSNAGVEVKETMQPFQSAEAINSGESEFVGDKLENMLSKLCQQSGFQSAIVADEQGLPVGGVNTAVEINELAAFSSVLGGVIDRVPDFFKQYDAGSISVDINYVEKAVVQKILIGEVPFFLLIICSQDIDERAYIELFSDQITQILKR